MNIDQHLLALLRAYADQPDQLRQRLIDATPAEIFGELDFTTRNREMHRAESDLLWLEEENHHLLQWDDEDYPEQLREVSNPPWGLWLKGNRSCLTEPTHRIAMVGARKASRYGLHQAREMAAQLVQQGVAVVSGMALGIDAAAHEGALQGDGITIAVLGTGCDAVYPRRHWKLADRIHARGLLISEFPLGTAAFPGNFPRRNRIITGMCEATLVIEAAQRSGSLVSARLALAQGREVMALPGLVTNTNAAGCHQLIRDGAALIESAEDVLTELGLAEFELGIGKLPISANPVNQPLPPEDEEILQHIAVNPGSIDSLVADLRLPVDEVTVRLVGLEVMGLIYSENGVYFPARAVEQSPRTC